jgi:hypothetical protein
VADGSHVLRLIVANSGGPNVTGIAPTRGRRRITTFGAAPANEAAQTEEFILSAFEKWHASRQGSEEEADRTARGIWRVGRMVRSYHGSVLIRAADVAVSVLYGKAAEGAEVTERGLGRMPGALTEVTILTDPRPQAHAVPWDYLSPGDDATQLRWVNCTFDPRLGISDQDRKRLEDAADAVHHDPTISGVVATVSTGSADQDLSGAAMRRAMRAALETAGQIANTAAIVVVFHDTNAHVLDLCVAGFNEDSAAARNDERTSSCGPVLVVGSDGGPFWVGGTAALRAVITGLFDVGGTLPMIEAERRWSEAGGTPSEYSLTLSRYAQLLESGGGKITLRLSPRDTHRILEALAASELADAIERGSDGVEVGRFRGPTLRITNRWIDAGRLLSGTIGTSLAAFLLARKVEAALLSSAEPSLPTIAVQVGSAPWQLVEQVSECLSLGGRYYPLPAELDIGDLPIGERVPDGATVVLCADVVSTENSVRRAAATIAGGGAEPLVIACVVDAREKRGPIRLLDREIPVVSLTEANVSSAAPAADGKESITDIDPLLLRPYIRGSLIQESVRETDLLRWCATDPDTLRLGHVDWPPHRHFSAVILLDHVLRRRKIRNKITGAVIKTMQDALAEIDGLDDTAELTSPALEIWYVDSRDGNAGRLAKVVHQRLLAQGSNVSALIAVPRGTAGDNWAFPAAVRPADGTRPVVVLLGWSTVTGTTLLQTIRLAANRGASRIVAVSMLHQLDTTDAEALVMLHTVSTRPADAALPAASGGGRHAVITQPIPVAVRFVTVSSITVLAARDCAICTTQERYGVGDDAIPHRLRNYAEQLHDLLRPRSIEEVSRNTAADLFSVPITSDDVVDYLRWRGLLLRALRNLPARAEIIERLQILPKRQPAVAWRREGLIRLLAAEQQWLKLPPLRFSVARELLSQTCLTSLEKLVTASPWLRVQSLIVLFATAPEQLVELLPQVLSLVADETLLLDQLFLDCYRLLLRPSRDFPIDVEQFRHNLVRFRDRLEEVRRQEGDSASIDEHLHVLSQLIMIADYRILRKPTDSQAAWERLREDLVRPVRRHGLESDLLLVRGFVEDLEEVEPTAESAMSARANWNICARQLQERVLANLPALRDILAGDFVADWLGRRDQRRLLSLAHADVMELRAVTERLHRLTAEPWQPAYPPWRALRRELLDRLNWWNRMFLAAHVPDHHSPAVLVELAGSAPARLGDRVAAVLASQGVEASIDRPSQGNVLVFCPTKLLDQVVAHLIENVQRHCPAGATWHIQISYEYPSSEHVNMILRNAGTKPLTKPGQGLKSLNEKLRPFGGTLTGNTLTEGEWTFEAIAKLALWQKG